MTTWKSVLAVAALLAATSPAGTAFAGADDYVFEPVNAQIKSSNVATVAVRLVYKPSRHGAGWNGVNGCNDRAAAQLGTGSVRLQSSSHDDRALAVDGFRKGAGRA